MTFGQLAARAARLWESYTEALPTWEKTLSHAALCFLRSPEIAETPVEFVLEVQCQYRPFVDLGRKRTHLHYKIVRAAEPATLRSDFDRGSKYTPPQLQTDVHTQRTAYALSCAQLAETLSIDDDVLPSTTCTGN